MPTYDALGALPGGEPGPWADPVEISYNQRDVLLYAVGIGVEDLRYVYEGHPDYAVFPTFPIRWGGAGSQINDKLIPRSPLPLMIDAERCLFVDRPLPLEGTVSVSSRIVGIHPRGKGAGFVEHESKVTDADGNVCIRMINGSFRRGVNELGDIEPFEGSGGSLMENVSTPDTDPDVVAEAKISTGQAHVYRLSGDLNPLHIDPAAAKFGGFDEPILHGLCTYGFCAHTLAGALCDGDAGRMRTIKVRFTAPVFPGDTIQIRAWHDGDGRVLFEGRVGDRVVVSNAYFEYDPA